MPLPTILGELGALATRSLGVPRTRPGATPPFIRPGVKTTTPLGGGGPLPSPNQPDHTPDADTSDDSDAGSGIGSAPSMGRLTQPNLTLNQQTYADLLRQGPPAAKGGVRGVLGGLAGALGLDFVAEPLKYPGLYNWQNQVARAKALSATDDEALKRQEAQQRINESVENQRYTRDLRQQNLDLSKQNAYQRQMGDIEKAGGFEAPNIPAEIQSRDIPMSPQLTQIPGSETDTLKSLPQQTTVVNPGLLGAVSPSITRPNLPIPSQTDIVKNLPQKSPLLIPGMTPQQSSNLGTVQSLKDPSGEVRNMVRPNLRTQQEMAQGAMPKVTPEMEEATGIKAGTPVDKSVFNALLKITNTPEKPVKEVANPEQVLLNPDKYSQSQVKTARELFAQSHRDPNAIPGAPGAQNARTPGLPPGQRDDQFLSKLDPGVQSVVKQLVDYKYQLPNGIALSKPYWQNILQLAAQYDPSFDASQYQNRQALRKDFMSGKSAQSINALNTVAQHIDKLEQNWKALNNTNTLPGVINPIANAVGGQTSADLQRRLNKFQLDQEAVSTELMRVWRQVGASESEIKQWSAKLSANLSPEAQQGAIQEIYDLIKGKMAALKNMYETGMGKPADFRMLDPETAKRFKQHGIDPTDLSPGATYGASASPQQQNPNPNGYIPGHIYGGLTYKGGDPNNAASWQK